MSHTLASPLPTPAVSVSSPSSPQLDPVQHRAEFVTTPAAPMDLTRRVGLALAVLTSAGDAEAARARAIHVLLTGTTDDALTLS